MMRNLFVVLTAATFIYACGGDDGPGGGGSGTPTDFKACFTQDIDGGIVSFNSDCSEGATIYSWDFGDGSTSAEESPTHEYQNSGTYTVKLSIRRNSFSTAQEETETIIEIEEHCIECLCAPGSTNPSGQFCSTMQKADSACVACNTFIDCACDTINVDEGYYVYGSATSNNPSEDYELQQGVVDDFGATPPFRGRIGYYENFMYLKEGVVRIIAIGPGGSGNVIYGGTLVSEGLGSGVGDFLVGSLDENGQAYNVTQAGLHWIGMDLTSSTWYIMPIENIEIIGPANQGWSSGTALSLKSADENQVVFEGTEIQMDNSYFKIRFNSNWNNDRTFASPPVDGLNILTSFGPPFLDGDENSGSQLGGYNYLFGGNPGIYTIEISHAKGAGTTFESNYTRTGGGSNPFDPANFNWGIIGSATATGWDSDTDLLYRGLSAGTHLWVGMVFLRDGEFKYRANDAWDINLGAGQSTHGGSAAGQISGSDNYIIDVPGDSAYYYIKLSTSNDGASWDIVIEPGSWGIVGAATPGGWDSSTPLSYIGNGIWQSTVSMSPDEFKFRVNDEWEINLGGDLNNLFQDGPNLVNSGSGSLTVTLFTLDKGLTYQATIF